MCICLAAFLRLARESGGGNAIKLLLRLILGLSLGVAMLLAKIQPSTLVFLPETFTAKTAFSAMRSASEPVLRYVAGSTIKVEQLIVEEDKQVH
jgi:flagellar biosynthesis protein FliQ